MPPHPPHPPHPHPHFHPRPFRGRRSFGYNVYQEPLFIEVERSDAGPGWRVLIEILLKGKTVGSFPFYSQRPETAWRNANVGSPELSALRTKLRLGMPRPVTGAQERVQLQRWNGATWVSA